MLHQSERYVVDADGVRVAVLLGIEEYQRLLDELVALRSIERTDAVGKEPAGIEREPQLETAERDGQRHPDATFHPRSPDASPERLRAILGSITLMAPVAPRSWRFMDEDDDVGSITDNGGH